MAGQDDFNLPEEEENETPQFFLPDCLIDDVLTTPAVKSVKPAPPAVRRQVSVSPIPSFDYLHNRSVSLSQHEFESENARTFQKLQRNDNIQNEEFDFTRSDGQKHHLGGLPTGTNLDFSGRGPQGFIRRDSSSARSNLFNIPTPTDSELFRELEYEKTNQQHHGTQSPGNHFQRAEPSAIRRPSEASGVFNADVTRRTNVSNYFNRTMQPQNRSRVGSAVSHSRVNSSDNQFYDDIARHMFNRDQVRSPSEASFHSIRTANQPSIQRSSVSRLSPNAEMFYPSEIRDNKFQSTQDSSDRFTRQENQWQNYYAENVSSRANSPGVEVRAILAAAASRSNYGSRVIPQFPEEHA